MLLLFCACAEEAAGIVERLELDELQRAAVELGTEIDIKGTILGVAAGNTRLDGEFLREIWDAFGGQAAGYMRDIFALFLGPVFLSAIYMRIFHTGGGMCGLVCSCACAAVFVDVLGRSADETGRLISGISQALEAAVPVLTGLAAMGGGTSSAAILTPMANLAGEIMVRILGDAGLALTGAAGVCACACMLSSRFRLDGLFNLIKRAVQTGAGFSLAVFAGILKVQGMLGASFDSAAIKTARFAVDKIVPVVGGGISDTMDAALSSIMLIKNAAGVTGMLVIASACALPIIKLGAALIAIRLVHAIAQPVADGVIMDSVEKFGDVIRLLLVLSITSVTIGLILTGAAVGAGRSVG